MRNMNAADWKTAASRGKILGPQSVFFWGFWWRTRWPPVLIGLDVPERNGGPQSAVSRWQSCLERCAAKLGSDDLQDLSAPASERGDGAPMVKLREAGRYLHVVIGDDEVFCPIPNAPGEASGRRGCMAVVTLSMVPEKAANEST